MPTTPLLVKVMAAYLSPLLEKHQKGTALVYEDLVASWQAAQALLKEQTTPAVQKQITQLHQQQIKAYESAAKEAMTAYAKTAKGSLQSALDDAPAWKFPKPDLLALIQKERARVLEAKKKALAAKQEEAKKEEAKKKALAAKKEEAQKKEEAEEGAATEDDEEEMEDGEEEEEEGEEKKTPAKKKQTGKQVPKKKALKTKATRSNARRGGRGRGRGGGNTNK